MHDFELWLDESGSFKEDNLILKNDRMPSLVGGLLFDCSKDLSEILALAPSDGSHATENTNVQESFDRVMSLAQKDIRFVVFQNREKMLIVDDKITYLNVITEGIIQLIEKLKSENGDEIHLKILAAERRDNPLSDRINQEAGITGAYEKIRESEYIKRLREKIIIEGLSRNIGDTEWELVLGSAKHDPKLLLCDQICNMIFTKDTKVRRVLGNEQSDALNAILDDNNKTIQFSVLPNIQRRTFQQYISEYMIGQAIAYICQIEDDRILSECMGTAVDIVKKRSGKGMSLQYAIMQNIFQQIVTESRDFGRCVRMLKNIRSCFIDRIETNLPGYDDRQFRYMKFDISFCLLTVYTHIGDLKSAEDCINECEKLISDLPRDWEFLAYEMKYLLRKIIHQINQFDYEGAEVSCGEAIEKAEKIKEAMELADEDHEGHFTELAKAYGTMAQIKASLPGRETEAREYSDLAINEFYTVSDKQRQYMYRIYIEALLGNESGALKSLKQSLRLPKTADLERIAAALDQKVPGIVYSRATAMRLVAEGKRRGFASADKIYQAMVKQDFFADLRKLTDQEIEAKGHPLEYFYWKQADYAVMTGQKKLAFTSFDRAAKICFYNKEETTMEAIGISVLLEKYAYCLRIGDSRKQSVKRAVEKQLKHFYNQKLPERLADLYRGIDLTSQDPDTYTKRASLVSRALI